MICTVNSYNFQCFFNTVRCEKSKLPPLRSGTTERGVWFRVHKPFLTLSEMTNFRTLQTERVCTRQF